MGQTNSINHSNEANSCINLDYQNVEEIVNYVKSLHNQPLSIDEDFASTTGNIELHCNKLIPMCMELIEKASKVVPLHKPDHKKRYSKKFSQVKPTFPQSEIRTRINDTTILPMFQYIIPNPKIKYITQPITLDEFNTSFADNIKLNPDVLGMSKKMIKKMGNYHKKKIINQYNKLLRGDISNKDLCFGKASYIHKRGEPNIIKSFRQIVVIPNVVNHFHRIISLRINEYIIKNNYFDTSIQKGGVRGNPNAIFEQIFKVKEVIKDANTNKKSLSIMFVDITDAFGSLKVHRLLEIMRKYHFDESIINYVKTYYENFQYYVKLYQYNTNLVKWGDGVVTGCPMSCILFVIVLNYFLTHLDTTYKEQHGYSINNNAKIMLTAYIDDLCIICEDTAKLEFIYNKLKEMLSSVGFTLNQSKCSTMFINSVTKDIDDINPTKIYKYLGAYITSDSSVAKSYTSFVKDLQYKMIYIDKKRNDNIQKNNEFFAYILPWMRRTLIILYDLSLQQRLQIIKYTKPFLLKWGNKDPVNLFTCVFTQFAKTKDNVITEMDLTEYHIEDTELANSIIVDDNVRLVYNGNGINVEQIAQ